MKNSSGRNFKHSLRKILGRYYSLAGVIIFLLGVILRLSAIDKTGFIWEVAKDLGSFLVVAVAVPFLYEILIKSEERQIFLNDLEEIIDDKLNNFQSDLIIYQDGRPKLSEKTDLIASARHEVINLGIAHRSFISYFEQRPSREFQDPIIQLLKNGVILKCIFLDPDSDMALKYAEDRAEPELINRIRNSIDKLTTIRNEFAQQGLSGKIEIYASSHFPYFAATCIDGGSSNGRLLISSYLYGLKRAEVPHIKFSRYKYEAMFEKYWITISAVLSDSRKL